MITGRPKSSKLLPVPPEHGYLCGGGGGEGEEEHEEEGEGRRWLLCDAAKMKSEKDAGGQGARDGGRQKSSSDRRRDEGVQEQRLLLMSRVTQPKAS